MSEEESLAAEFELHRTHLRAVAYRMLGSLSEAEDAVQDAWLRLSHAAAQDVENLRAWLTRVVSRICLDVLRARKVRREEPLSAAPPEAVREANTVASPDEEAELAESVGVALLVVLDRLAAAERLAFVLHDMFDVSFEEIATITERSVEAARQLASRARRRVKGDDQPVHTNVVQQRKVVDAYLAAARNGDFEALLAVLDPDVVVRTHNTEVRGARLVASNALRHRARLARPALIDGSPALIIAPRGRLKLAILFENAGDRIAALRLVVGEEMARLEIAILSS